MVVFGKLLGYLQHTGEIMSLYGSASCNLSPILFRGSNSSLGVNIIIHMDISGSMSQIGNFYTEGTIIETLQSALLSRNIGNDYLKYPNLYAFFGLYSKNPTSSFTITNNNGTLNISQGFIRGEASASVTKNNWINSYAYTSTKINICTDVIGQTTGGRLFGSISDTEDVHGNLWSIYTSPNAISTGTPGIYGSVISSSIRTGCSTIVIVNSDEQDGAPSDMINQLVAVNSSGSQERTINGNSGELIFRGYRIIALNSYTSSDGYDGVLFYGNATAQPYGYVTFLSTTTYSIIRSSSAPNWTKDSLTPQLQDTLTLATETRGALFKISRVYDGSTVDNRISFSNALAEFISQTS